VPFKIAALGLAFVAVLAMGLVIGYTLKPSVDVQVFDPADTELPPPLYDARDPAVQKLHDDPLLREIVNEGKRWRPLAKTGPLQLYCNPDIDGYMVGGSEGQFGLMWQETCGDKVELTIWGKRREVHVTLTYDRVTGKRIRSVFESNAEGGLLAPTKWIYHDNDGDGRFDHMVDCEAGVGYEQRGLQWVEGSRNPDKKHAPPKQPG